MATENPRFAQETFLSEPGIRLFFGGYRGLVKQMIRFASAKPAFW